VGMICETHVLMRRVCRYDLQLAISCHLNVFTSISMLRYSWLKKAGRVVHEDFSNPLTCSLLALEGQLS
jgi:hypothetical protein